jgi:hypothetical protein
MEREPLKEFGTVGKTWIQYSRSEEVITHVLWGLVLMRVFPVCDMMRKLWAQH